MLFKGCVQLYAVICSCVQLCAVVCSCVQLYAVVCSSKLRILGLDRCPYQHPADSWLNNPNEWPKLEYGDVYNYLIKSPGGY